MPKKAKKKALYVITRAGGWDGCAMQAELWIDVLLKNGYEVTLLTGEFEEETTNFHPYNKINIVIKNDLSLSAQSKLYISGFEEQYERKKWVKKFIDNKNEIKKEICEYFNSHNLIILHNISLRYLIPSLWGAIYELSLESPKKRIISIEPDSPYERRYLLNRYNLEVLHMLHHPSTWYQQDRRSIYKTLNQIKKMNIKMLPGPIHNDNTHHLILNSYQYNAHRDIFGVPESHLVKISDMGRFEKKKNKYPDQNFFDYLIKSQVICIKKKITHDDLFFISPVRPVYRKNIRYLLKIMSQFRMYIKEKKNLAPQLFLIITHKNKDDPDYFNNIIELAEQLDITVIYTGDSLKLRRITKEKNAKAKTYYTYYEFLSTLSNLKSICFSGSAFGGWENAIVECSENMIPVFVNPKIPAFGDMIKKGYIYRIIPFINMPSQEELLSARVWEKHFSLEFFFENIYDLFYDISMRKKIIDNNFQIGKKYQSMAYISKNKILPLLEGKKD